MFLSWLRGWRDGRHCRSRNYRPVLEALETRDLPSGLAPVSALTSADHRSLQVQSAVFFPFRSNLQRPSANVLGWVKISNHGADITGSFTVSFTLPGVGIVPEGATVDGVQVSAVIGSTAGKPSITIHGLKHGQNEAILVQFTYPGSLSLDGIRKLLDLDFSGTGIVLVHSNSAAIVQEPSARNTPGDFVTQDAGGTLVRKESNEIARTSSTAPQEADSPIPTPAAGVPEHIRSAVFLTPASNVSEREGSAVFVPAVANVQRPSARASGLVQVTNEGADIRGSFTVGFRLPGVTIQPLSAAIDGVAIPSVSGGAGANPTITVSGLHQGQSVVIFFDVTYSATTALDDIRKLLHLDFS